MNLPGQATLRSSVVKARLRCPSELYADAGLALGDSHAALPGVVRGLDVLVQGCGLGVLERVARERRTRWILSWGRAPWS